MRTDSVWSREIKSFRASPSVFASRKQVIFCGYFFTNSNVLTEILSFELESTPFFFSISDGKERARCDQHRWNWASFCVFDRNSAHQLSCHVTNWLSADLCRTNQTELLFSPLLLIFWTYIYIYISFQYLRYFMTLTFNVLQVFTRLISASLLFWTHYGIPEK